MKIFKETANKRKYMDLLLLADEQQSMIEKYLERGELYVLDDGGIKAVCVITCEGAGVAEIKNLAVHPSYRRMGYGRLMVEYVKNLCRKSYKILQVGTGDSPLTIPFYTACGFKRSHTVKNFFTDNYDRPIYEAGVLLKDMIYLRMYL